MSADARVGELGIVLPEPPGAAGLYVPVQRSGSLLFIAGQIPQANGVPLRQGYVGGEVTVEEAQQLARQCALQAVSLVRQCLGTLDLVRRVVRVGGFVASAKGFSDQPSVLNGASQLLVDIFGDAGKHARVAVGVAELPRGVPVEVEFLFEVA